MTKSICLCVWQGDPVGEKKILQLGERIWPTRYYDKSPSKWECACNILRCWIGALWPRMIPPTSSIICSRKWHFVLKCTGHTVWIRLSSNQRDCIIKNAHLIFNWVTRACFIITFFSPIFLLIFFVGGTKHDPGLLMAVLVINCAERYLPANTTARCYLETSN